MQAPHERRSVKDFNKGGTPIVCLTSYTAPMARLLDRHVDLLLVGDSVGMVLYGFDNTLSVTLEMMIAHGAAVVRSSSRAFVAVDMPYGSYEQSPEQALANAKRIVKETGCGAVKLEGGKDMAATVRLLVENDIPVIGHVGLMPQSIEKMGGFKIQGRNKEQADQVLEDAIAISEAGAFLLVVEGTVEPLAREITARVSIPTIGIGASVACDGQILVIDDLLGTFGTFQPRFAKRYAELAPIISEAVEHYAADVRERRFPGPEHCFPAK
ncbi:MAG TPA: 3-methyl-2-oxobutanoate hydroxymethyltransferase [Alphaproteobacteria bacterium]|nr:3-methyl-2-oxobutanoate hydroxymethyltransferase [Alphaproteobacteria bacterium]